MSEEQVQPETQSSKIILVQLLLVVCTELVRGGLARDNRQLMCVDQGPRAGVSRVLGVPIEQPDPGDDEGVVRPRVAELVPPVFTDWG